MVSRELRDREPPLKRKPVVPRWIRLDSYGLVLTLIVADYVVVTSVSKSGWGNALAVILSGCTLLITLRTSAARAIWQLLALCYLLASVLLAIIGAAVPGPNRLSQAVSILGGLLLLGMPVVVLRHIATSPRVTTEILLGAVCVYLLLGFSFAFVFQATSFLSSTPFFVDVQQATAQQYFFFSYTTLTTVGYGNLIPAENIGQTLAMLEALSGQVYLVVVVARLVSLWGTPRAGMRMREAQQDPPDALEDGGASQSQEH